MYMVLKKKIQKNGNVSLLLGFEQDGLRTLKPGDYILTAANTIYSGKWNPNKTIEAPDTR